MGTFLKGKNLLPEEANSFLYGMDNHFYYIRWAPLSVTFFIAHVRIGATPMKMSSVKVVCCIHVYYLAFMTNASVEGTVWTQITLLL